MANIFISKNSAVSTFDEGSHDFIRPIENEYLWIFSIFERNENLKISL